MHQIPSVLLVEDQQLLRLGLKVSLNGTGCCVVTGEAECGETAVKEAQRLRPDIILMDVGLPGIDGIEATWQIKKELPRTRVIMFTSHTEPQAVSAAFGAGADAYCAKETPIHQIVNAITAVSRGETWLDPTIADLVVRDQQGKDTGSARLSQKELDILALIREEISNCEIANRLNTNPETIERALHNIITRFVQEKSVASGPNDQQRGHLNEWLTAFVPDMESGNIFDEKYLVEGVIGAGGIGTVYKARHLFIERDVALKLLRPEMSEDRLIMRSLQREATAIANISHKNIVALYDFGLSSNKQAFLTMEYIEGSNMADLITAEKRMTIPRTVALCTQICDGLAEAHHRGVVHCDLKPSNILVMNTPQGELIKLVDFGLVQLLPRESAQQLQATDKYLVCGSPLYMPPEQCAGKPTDERADIYALGCVLFECLTGETVFDGDTAMEIFAKQMRAPAPSLTATYPEGLFPRDLEDLVAKMLEKNPCDRPQSMEEVKSALLEIATEH